MSGRFARSTAKRWIGYLCLVSLAFTLNGKALAEPSTQKSLFVGIYLNRQEVDNLEILEEEGAYLVPFDAVVNLLKIDRTTNADQTITLTTPLGAATFQPTELKQVKGITYLRESLLSERLAIKIRFSSQDYALFFEVPWQVGTVAIAPKAIPKPEASPPQNGLSNLRTSTSFNLANEGADLGNSVQIGGQLGGGSWQVQMDYANLLQGEDSWQRPQFSQYFYQNDIGPFRYRVGKQAVQLHPLLSNIDVTGAQVAFTNQSEVFENNSSDQTLLNSTELLSRRSQPLESFRGKAPPASVVQLRVDGVVIDQQQARLDGQYEFLDIPFGLGTDRQIEILIFDRANLRVPIETRVIRLNATDLLMPKASVSHLVGVGLSGNLIDQAITGSNDSLQPVAFYQWRQGFSDNLTLEAAIQKVPEAVQAQAGLVWRFADPWVMELGTGLNDRGDLAYTFTLSGSYPNWRVQLDSNYVSQGFKSGSSGTERDTFNHSIDFSYDINSRLTLGAIARIRQDEEGRYQYILPTLSWRPFSALSLRGRPDSKGQYYYDAYFRPSRRSELALTGTTDNATLDFRYDITESYQINIGTDIDRALAPRYYAILTRSGQSLRDPSIGLGVSVRDGELGFIASGSMELFPGVLATLQYQSQPRSSSGSDFDQNFQFLLSTDFSINKGRFQAANSGLLSQNQGAITGRLVPPQGATADGDTLADSLVTATLITAKRRINITQASAQTDNAGNFSFSSLPAGIYTVVLTPEKLPIQYTPTKTRIIAEVKGGAITPVDFPLLVEYGLAGRIMDSTGKPLAEIEVELLDQNGKPVAVAFSDEFGLYRMDRIRPGRYTLTPSANNAPTVVKTRLQRSVEIQNDFLFGQDLQISNPD
jgi:hypothetical protein